MSRIAKINLTVGFPSRKTAYILTLLWMVLSVPSFGQENVRDSLTRELRKLERLQKETPSTNYVDVLNELSQAYRFVKADSVRSMANRALNLSEKIGYLAGRSEALANIGGYHSDNGNNQKAIAYYKNAIIMADSIGDVDGKIGIMNSLANEYSYLGNYEKALSTFLIGLDLAKEHDLKVSQSILNENIASLYT